MLTHGRRRPGGAPSQIGPISFVEVWERKDMGSAGRYFVLEGSREASEWIRVNHDLPFRSSIPASYGTCMFRLYC